jgi:MoxR-like ATPase
MDYPEELENPELARMITIDNVDIHLRSPASPGCDWIGNTEPFRFLSAAWLKMHAKDSIMAPVLIGPPGCGKTTLARAVAKVFDLPVYLMNCTSDMRPDDLLITPVIANNNQVLYRASGLVSAMVNGGICVLDEANRMNEKSWASLASLLDDRRYIESISSGTKIIAHPEFRIVATMNDDSSTFTVPDYIESRLKPVLPVEFPSMEDLKKIITYHMPFIAPGLEDAVVQYLEEQKQKGSITSYSIRDAINITRFFQKFPETPYSEMDSIARKILKVHEQPVTLKKSLFIGI